LPPGNAIEFIDFVLALPFGLFELADGVRVFWAPSPQTFNFDFQAVNFFLKVSNASFPRRVFAGSRG